MKQEAQPAAQNGKPYFFDATLKENHGKPLHKQLVIDGFSIYIEAGSEDETFLLSEPGTVDKPSPELLDKAMQLM